jgi:hypothetical protein
MEAKSPKERFEAAVERWSGLADSFLDGFRRHGRAVAAGAAFLFILSLFLFWIALAHPFARRAEPPQEAAAPAPELLCYARALDGVCAGSATSTSMLPFAVMVENSRDAWPLSGPARANIVFEAEVEGGMTRFMLVFDPSNDVAEIGPVRSARPYYADWADGLDALYAHVGGSPASLNQIGRMDGFRDLNEFSNGKFFWRSDSHAAPHNVFTNIERLVNAAADKEYEAGEFRPWLYEDDEPDEAGANGTASEADDEPDQDADPGRSYEEQESAVEFPRVNIPYAGAYKAHWEYDANTGLYTRYQNGEEQKDADGEVVKARNVAVIQTYAAVIDGIGRLSMRTAGSGRAFVFHDGRKEEGIWKRAAGEHIRFETVDGRDIPFARGTTWISVLTSNREMNQVLND